MSKSDVNVYLDGMSVLRLNKRMLDAQDAWDNLDLIKFLHQERIILGLKMLEMNESELPQADKDYTDIEFKLQDAWGFPRDIKWHKFWNRPRCTCPRMDNEDSYPTGYSVISGDCPLHGK